MKAMRKRFARNQKEHIPFCGSFWSPHGSPRRCRFGRLTRKGVSGKYFGLGALLSVQKKRGTLKRTSS